MRIALTRLAGRSSRAWRRRGPPGPPRRPDRRAAETSNDGTYACAFAATDRQGSFRISAPGKPTIRLEIDRPGVAFGFADFGARTVALPGRYRRSTADPACWVNDETGAKVCAW